MNRRATPEQLQDLLNLVVASLLDRMAGKASTELLQVARAVLRDNGLAGRASTADQRVRLRGLYDLYVDRLLEAVRAESPSAAVLAEARMFLVTQGIDKDLAPVVDAAEALATLKSQDLPFN
jgi:hypothetical protein